MEEREAIVRRERDNTQKGERQYSEGRETLLRRERDNSQKGERQ
jgi:hypothetical protein